MTLLEVITKASASTQLVAPQSGYPIILNPDDVFLDLKPQLEKPDPTSLLCPVTGWKISQTDSDLIELAEDFCKKLKQKLKNRYALRKFIPDLNAFLEEIKEKYGIYINVKSSNSGYTEILIEKVGFLMGRNVAALVLEAFILLEKWELVESLIVNRLVGHSCYSKLIMSLVEKRRSDLLCLCIKHASDLKSSDLLCILKYFLCPPLDAYGTMLPIKKELESQGLLAIKKATVKNLNEKQLQMAREASVLLMIAHDGFTSSEICLHYLIASSNVDEMILSSSIGKLSAKEMKRLLQYLGKWLRKYEKFPEAGPCPEASSLGLKACDWVPKLKDVVEFFGLLLDENYSSLVLHSEFHEELGLIAGSVSSLAMEAKFSCVVANIVEKLKNQVKDAKN